ncbi:unnamed protein product [Acanthoscelides obtectus]|uniref:Uncharacterized protein n=1 Tax=Acanthoscelides obtectus TaxID=200917 RepID=A0A9P0NRX3_ACAOB|nr:unnamed protein product [Acanthoscelides obtectus]CAK1661313.1 hypothetical protein AOBTE_LOCUS22566 [Acanthoscelides obtectus]
MAGGGNSTHKT